MTCRRNVACYMYKRPSPVTPDLIIFPASDSTCIRQQRAGELILSVKASRSYHLILSSHFRSQIWQKRVVSRLNVTLGIARSSTHAHDPPSRCQVVSSIDIKLLQANLRHPESLVQGTATVRMHACVLNKRPHFESDPDGTTDTNEQG